MAEPYRRWEGFHAYQNPDDDAAHVLVFTGDSGYVFADNFTDLESAEWAAQALNAALAARPLTQITPKR